MQRKKQLILWVLNLLETESDESKPITQTKIADIISKVYPCDRKTVGRNIKFLIEMQYPIRKTSRGFYMDNRVYSVDEVNFVKTAILSAEGLNEAERSVLAEKVAYTLTKLLRR